VYGLKRAGEVYGRPGGGPGCRRATLVEGAVHHSLDLCSLDAGASVDRHLHSFEESFYVLSGEPVVELGGHAVRLAPGSGGLVPVAVEHSWRSDGPATWIEMAAPRRRGDDEPADTFLVGPAAGGDPAGLDVRDPRSRRLFQLDDEQLDVARSSTQGAPVDAPDVSPSMTTAVLAYSGIAVKMLVDAARGAHLHWTARSRRSPTATSSRFDRATRSGRASAASTDSGMRPTAPSAGSRRRRRSRRRATRTVSTGTGIISPDS
jgi:mannose-6-phosphate isomerase-like protein (cupin superfamily)